MKKFWRILFPWAFVILSTIPVTQAVTGCAMKPSLSEQTPGGEASTAPPSVPGPPERDPSRKLFDRARTFFTPLPDRPDTEETPREIVQLGEALFFEPDISIFPDRSCNTCHPVDFRRGGADNLTVPAGWEEIPGARNVPTVLNALNGAATSKEDPDSEQLSPETRSHMALAVTPLAEEGFFSWAFRRAFPKAETPLTRENATRALEIYLRTLVTRDRFDLYLRGRQNALTGQEQEGLRVFMDRDCIGCHGGSLLGGILPGNVSAAPIEESVPQLRNVLLTSPYFRDGTVGTLPEAIERMGTERLNVALSDEEIRSILRFFTALTDIERVSAPPPFGGEEPDSWNLSAPGSGPGENAGILRTGFLLTSRPLGGVGGHESTTPLIPSGNALSCGSCHQDDGTKPYGLPWIGLDTGSTTGLVKQINDCIRRGLHGEPLPEDSSELQAMASYIEWLNHGRSGNSGQGIADIGIPERRAWPEDGQNIYRYRCQGCHGAKGEGYRTGGNERRTWIVPPLWGSRSYPDGSPMHRVLFAAGFIRGNMPWGTSWKRPALKDEEALDIAAYINSFPRPETGEVESDYPDVALKPLDCPFPPYSDGFSREQHKYGPFGPILRARTTARNP